MDMVGRDRATMTSRLDTGQPETGQPGQAGWTLGSQRQGNKDKQAGHWAARNRATVTINSDKLTLIHIYFCTMNNTVSNLRYRLVENKGCREGRLCR